mgnify:CR=1 FL=1
MEQPKTSPYIALVVGVISVSFAAIFIKQAAAPAAIVAFYRMGLATLILAPFIIPKRMNEFKSLSKGQIGFLILSGFLLALHFLLWITSFAHTSVASSVIFVTTQPVFVAIAAAIFLNEKPGLLLLCGIALSCVGSMVIGAGDLSLSMSNLYGDLMALGGSVMAAGYFLVGRHLRKSLSLGVYILSVYGICAIFLAFYILFNGLPLVGYDSMTWFSMIMLALVPTIVGHSSFNWALKYLHASVVSASMLGEPVGATLLAWLILKEKPQTFTFIGGALILCGIYLTSMKLEKLDNGVEEKSKIETQT